MEEVIFDNGSEFKKDFGPLLKDFAVKPKMYDNQRSTK